MSHSIAFIGLGIMGKPMALNLLAAGHKLLVYARHEKSMHPLIEAGASACSSPAAAAHKADFIITMVSDTPDVEEVIIKYKDSIIHGAHPHSLVIDMSTISPKITCDIATQLKEKSISMLDAPVSGGETGAIDGCLSIMVGGSQADYNRALPLFEIMGEKIVHIGNNGAGQIAKACNQILVAQTMIGVAEAFELARAANVDPSIVRTALLGGFAYSRILELHGQRMLNEDYIPGFKAKLHYKDLKNTLEAAATLNTHLPCSLIAYEYMKDLVNSGDGELDCSAIAKVVHKRTKNQ